MTLMEKQLFIDYYSDDFQSEWDTFIHLNKCFTFQFQRKFLDLYNNEATDVSMMIRDKSDSLLAVIPLSANFATRELISHAKSTYGGVFFAMKTSLAMKKAIYAAIVSVLKNKFSGFTLELRVPPSHLTSENYSVDKWALWNNGFQPTVGVLHSAINLKEELNLIPGRVKKNHDDVKIVESSSSNQIIEFWDLLTRTLLERHGVEPVHNSKQILRLIELFPLSIRIFLAQSNFQEIYGGLVFFNTSRAYHLQYMAVGEIGRKKSVGDALIAESINIAMREDFEIFGFGHSNENRGKDVNFGLVSFKEKFGSHLNETFCWKIQL